MRLNGLASGALWPLLFVFETDGDARLKAFIAAMVSLWGLTTERPAMIFFVADEKRDGERKLQKTKG